MTGNNNEGERVQPWRAWFSDLIASRTNTESITMKGEEAEGMSPAKYGMSQHGTIALDPRTDVDLSKEKAKPQREEK